MHSHQQMGQMHHRSYGPMHQHQPPHQMPHRGYTPMQHQQQPPLHHRPMMHPGNNFRTKCSIANNVFVNIET